MATTICAFFWGTGLGWRSRIRTPGLACCSSSSSSEEDEDEEEHEDEESDDEEEVPEEELLDFAASRTVS